MEEVKDIMLYEAIIIMIIGIFIIVSILIFIIAILFNYRKWADERDKHYVDAHNNLEGKVDKIESATKRVIDAAADVVEAAAATMKNK